MTNTRWNLDQINRNRKNPDNFSDIIDIQEQTEAWIDNLKQSTIDSSLSTASTKSDLAVEKTWLKYERDIHTLVWFLSVVDKLLQEIDDTKKWISKKWLSKAWKQGMKEAKFKLNQYEKQLKNKKKALLKQKRAEIYDNDVANLKNSWQQVNLIREEIGMAQRGEYKNIASYLYNSPENAKKSNKRQASNLEFNQKFQEELKTWAISTIFNWNTQKTNDFFRRIAQWEYTQADYQIYERNSAILNPCFQRYGIAIPNNPRWSNWWRRVILLNTEQGNNLWWRTERVSRTVHRSTNYENMDWWETFKQWWISGILDKALSNCNNLTSWQRETWKNLWVLAWVWVWIFWLYKFFTNKKLNFWQKAWITVWTIFGTEVLLWETPLSLFNKLMSGWLSRDEMKNKFGNAISGLGNSNSGTGDILGWTEWVQWQTVESAWETIVPAMYSMMIFNSSTKKRDIDKMTQTFKDNKNRKTFYQKSCNKLQKEYGTEAMETFRATFSDQFDEEKRKNRLATFGVTDATSQNEAIYWLANNATMNKIILEKFQTENWLIITNREALNNYIQSKKVNNQPIDVDDLKSHINNNWKDRFKVNEKATNTERPEDIQDKETLCNQVESLEIDDQKKSKLKIAIQRFYDGRSIESKPKLSDFSLTMDRNFVVLTSHWWYKSTIDIDKNEIVGFWNGIRFTNLDELLNTADLSNKILESQKWKTPKSLPAFQYKWPTTIFENWIWKGGRWIYFNDAEIWRRNFNFDTRVLSGGWWWTTGEIETLSNHLEDYADYLSKRWLEENKHTQKTD